MKIPTVKECVMGAGDVKVPTMVNFVCYRHGQLWYVCDNGFDFPVPVSDIGDATFLARDRASYFMRYIRKHIEALEIAAR